jgi:calcium-dependent protein kinase
MYLLHIYINIYMLISQDHPRIVKIFQTFRFHKDAQFSAILMELCKGGDLESRQTSYTEQEVSIILQQILSAAAYLHERNIVHRDLKLQNVLFVDLEHLDVKIIDFGVAKKYTTKTERHYERYGTLYTMSPEAIKGSYSGSSTDLWSIGVIAYILLCKKKPFFGKTA